MIFAGINYVAVLIAAVAAWLAGAVWYMAFARSWTAALGKTPEQIEAQKKQPGAWLPFIYSFIAELVMAWVTAGLLGHLGGLSVRIGVISGLFVWLGYVITTMLVNNAFAGRDPSLLLIDGGHWLLVLVLIGGILGAIGV